MGQLSLFDSIQFQKLQNIHFAVRNSTETRKLFLNDQGNKCLNFIFWRFLVPFFP